MTAQTGCRAVVAFRPHRSCLLADAVWGLQCISRSLSHTLLYSMSALDMAFVPGLIVARFWLDVAESHGIALRYKAKI